MDYREILLYGAVAGALIATLYYSPPSPSRECVQQGALELGLQVDGLSSGQRRNLELRCGSLVDVTGFSMF